MFFKHIIIKMVNCIQFTTHEFTNIQILNYYLLPTSVRKDTSLNQT